MRSVIVVVIQITERGQTNNILSVKAVSYGVGK